MLLHRYLDIHESLGFRDGENAFVRAIKLNYRLVFSRKTKVLPLHYRVELFLFALWRPIAILYFLAILHDKTMS